MILFLCVGIFGYLLSDVVLWETFDIYNQKYMYEDDTGYQDGLKNAEKELIERGWTAPEK